MSHPYLTHLRLSFNALLSPIFLWGVLLAGGTLLSAKVWLAYTALHLFLYGGTTAFNSYYDKDEGPIGGLLEPPPVDRGLLVFSLVVQALGLPLAFTVSPSFGAAWLVLFAVFTAYSHPAVRLKASPAAALAAIALGQGAVGFAAGWLAAGAGTPSLVTAPGLFGMTTAALIVTGLYIVTQAYQTLEDRARGDRTLPVLLGPARALLVATGLLALGGVIMLAYVGARFGPGWAAALGLFFALVGVNLLHWAKNFDETEVTRNFRRAMRTATVSSLGLSLFLVYQLLR